MADNSFTRRIHLIKTISCALSSVLAAVPCDRAGGLALFCCSFSSALSNAAFDFGARDFAAGLETRAFVDLGFLGML